MGRSVMARKLIDYFQALGKIPTPAELNSDKDSPVQVKHIRRAWGTYTRCLRALQKRFPEEWNEVAPEYQGAVTSEMLRLSSREAEYPQRETTKEQIEKQKAEQQAAMKADEEPPVEAKSLSGDIAKELSEGKDE